MGGLGIAIVLYHNSRWGTGRIRVLSDWQDGEPCLVVNGEGTNGTQGSSYEVRSLTVHGSRLMVHVLLTAHRVPATVYCTLQMDSSESRPPPPSSPWRQNR